MNYDGIIVNFHNFFKKKSRKSFTNDDFYAPSKKAFIKNEIWLQKNVYINHDNYYISS